MTTKPTTTKKLTKGLLAGALVFLMAAPLGTADEGSDAVATTWDALNVDDVVGSGLWYGDRCKTDGVEVLVEFTAEEVQQALEAAGPGIVVLSKEATFAPVDLGSGTCGFEVIELSSTQTASVELLSCSDEDIDDCTLQDLVDVPTLAALALLANQLDDNTRWGDIDAAETQCLIVHGKTRTHTVFGDDDTMTRTRGNLFSCADGSQAWSSEHDGDCYGDKKHAFVTDDCFWTEWKNAPGSYTRRTNYGTYHQAQGAPPYGQYFHRLNTQERHDNTKGFSCSLTASGDLPEWKTKCWAETNNLAV